MKKVIEVVIFSTLISTPFIGLLYLASNNEVVKAGIVKLVLGGM